MRTGPGRAVPPANLTATANLNGKSARIDARLEAGSAQFNVAGQTPLGAGALDLRANGGLDLTLLDPILTAAGRRARGRLTLDAAITGTTSAPRVGGTAQLARGEVQDFTQGLRISDISAVIRGDGETVRIVSLTGKAGPGTIAVNGTVGVSAPGMPLDLTITASNARPITSDNLQINVDANLTVRGQAQAAMDVGGKVLIRNAEIRIPSRLPAKVQALNVIRPGQKVAAAAPAGPAPSINLNLVVDAPGQIFVRGRGVDAEMSGELRIRGSASKPQVAGGFDMRRGQLSVAGTTLDFSRGKVGFDGTGPGGKIDPTLDFVAEATGNGVTATLTIGGYASAPTIKLSSVPDLPQDEVLSYLLFRRSIKEIGPFQIASIAASLAELTGVGGEGSNPLGQIRSGLGLDRLNVGGSSTGSGATLEAGKYVTNGVYLGAKQGTSSDTGTGATLQIDITKGLKLQTDVGTGRGGNQVGLTYQFEY
jgi:translocation and assembly module TamB